MAKRSAGGAAAIHAARARNFKAQLDQIEQALVREGISGDIETPVGPARVPFLKGKKLTFVPILRAGNGLLDGLLELVPSARVTFCDFEASFCAKPASKKRSIGMSRPSSHTTGAAASWPWSCQVQLGVMMKSPGCIVVRSPSTAV